MNIVDYIRSQSGALYGLGSEKTVIKEAETILDLSFFDEYKTYLIELGVAAVNGHELTGISESKRLNVADVTSRQKEYNNVPEDFYVVEETGIDGIVIWQNSNGEIFATQPGLKAEKLCDSILEYLQKE